MGTEIVNSVSAVQASDGNLAAAEPTIIANAATAITALDKSGSVLAGLEAEFAAFGTSPVAAVSMLRPGPRQMSARYSNRFRIIAGGVESCRRS